jgi:hypothetical protein
LNWFYLQPIAAWLIGFFGTALFESTAIVVLAGGSTNLCAVSARLADRSRLGRDIHRIPQNFVLTARTKPCIQSRLHNRIAGHNGLCAGVHCFMCLD